MMASPRTGYDSATSVKTRLFTPTMAPLLPYTRTIPLTNAATNASGTAAQIHRDATLPTNTPTDPPTTMALMAIARRRYGPPLSANDAWNAPSATHVYSKACPVTTPTTRGSVVATPA